MAVRRLTNNEKEMLYLGLDMRRNNIETGNPNLSAKDVERMPEGTKKRYHAEIKALSTHQMQLIIKTEELVASILQDNVYIDD